MQDNTQVTPSVTTPEPVEPAEVQPTEAPEEPQAPENLPVAGIGPQDPPAGMDAPEGNPPATAVSPEPVEPAEAQPIEAPEEPQAPENIPVAGTGPQDPPAGMDAPEGNPPAPAVSPEPVEAQPIEAHEEPQAPENPPADGTSPQDPPAGMDAPEGNPPAPAVSSEPVEPVELQPVSDGEEQLYLASLNELDFSALVGQLRNLVAQEMSPSIRRKVEDVRTVFYRKLRAQHEVERREWDRKSEDHEPGEEFVASEIPEDILFKELYSHFREARREFQRRIEEEQQSNLRRKREIIDRIQALTQSAEVKNETYNEFSALRKEWGKIGHVPQNEMEELYKSYSHQVQSFYDYLKINRELRDLDYKKNFDAKIVLCERAESLIMEKDAVHAFRQLQSLHTEWKEIGPVPREKSDEIWARFSSASSRVNLRYHDHYERLRESQLANLEKKRNLLTQAETIDSTQRASLREWREASQQMIDLQKEWRATGPVPLKQHREITRRFFDIHEHFFNARKAYEKEVRADAQVNLQRKLDLCVQAEALKDSTDWGATSAELIALQKQWKEIGYTPRRKGNELWERFRAAADYFFKNRNQNQSSEREAQRENLRLKEELLREIEGYQPSEDSQASLTWLQDIQKRWSEIGYVPFRSKDEVQRRYRELIGKLYDALSIDPRRQPADSYPRRGGARAPKPPTGDPKAMEKWQLTQKVREMEQEKLQLSTNLTFITPSKGENPILTRLQEQLSALDASILEVQSKIKGIDQAIREEKKAQEATVDPPSGETEAQKENQETPEE